MGPPCHSMTPGATPLPDALLDRRLVGVSAWISSVLPTLRKLPLLRLGTPSGGVGGSREDCVDASGLRLALVLRDSEDTRCTLRHCAKMDTMGALPGLRGLPLSGSAMAGSLLSSWLEAAGL